MGEPNADSAVIGPWNGTENQRSTAATTPPGLSPEDLKVAARIERIELSALRRMCVEIAIEKILVHRILQ